MKRLVISMLVLALIVHLACDDSARTARPGPEEDGQGGAGASTGTAGTDLDGAIEGDDTGLRPGENDPGWAAGSGGAAGAGGDTLNGGAVGAGGSGGEAGGAGGDDRRDLGLSPVECLGDAECGAGYCRPVPNVEGAASYCVMPVDRPLLACEEPDADPLEGTCCQDRHCRDGARRGHCIVNTAGICGVAPPDEINICRWDQCYRGADCAANEVCIPAGFRGDLFNRCVRADCRITAECDAHPGGQCRILSAGTNCAGEPIFVCTYPEDVCRTDRDCFAGWRCVVGDAGISCQEATPDPS